MTLVRFDSVYPGGGSHAFGRIFVVLVTTVPGGASNGGEVIADTATVNLDADGKGEAELVPNDTLWPKYSFYRCTLEGSSPTLRREIVLSADTPSPISWAEPAIQVFSAPPPYVQDAPPGLSATIEVVGADTLEPGAEATVVNEGTVSRAELRFGIPKGEKGDDGDTTAADAAAAAAADAATTAHQTLVDNAPLAAQATEARDDAVQARDAAQGYANDSATEAGEAADRRDEAQLARDQAVTARTGAETARTGAETARTGAETARTGAETARDAAQGHATNAAASAATLPAPSLATAGQVPHVNDAGTAFQLRPAMSGVLVGPTVPTGNVAGKYWWDTTYGVLRYLDPDMRLTVDTTPTAGAVTVPLRGTVNCTVHWGDGTSNAYTTNGDKTHSYATPGTYQVRITGSLTAYGVGTGAAAPNAAAIRGVTSLGHGLGLTSLGGAFSECVNLTSFTATLPTTVTSILRFWRSCTSLTNLEVNSWNTSNVTSLLSAWFGCTSLTSLNLGSWNVSNVTNLEYAWYGCTALATLNIGSWNVANVTTLAFAWMNCTSLTSLNLGSWNVSKVATATSAIQGTTLTTASYSALLAGWGARTVLSGVAFHGGNSKYNATNGAAGRTQLVGQGWTITDGGPA